MSYAENRRRLDDAIKAARPMQAPPPRLGLVTQDFLDSVAPTPRPPLRPLAPPPLPREDVVAGLGENAAGAAQDRVARARFGLPAGTFGPIEPIIARFNDPEPIDFAGIARGLARAVMADRLEWDRPQRLRREADEARRLEAITDPAYLGEAEEQIVRVPRPRSFRAGLARAAITPEMATQEDIDAIMRPFRVAGDVIGEVWRAPGEAYEQQAMEHARAAAMFEASGEPRFQDAADRAATEQIGNVALSGIELTPFGLAGDAALVSRLGRGVGRPHGPVRLGEAPEPPPLDVPAAPAPAGARGEVLPEAGADPLAGVRAPPMSNARRAYEAAGQAVIVNPPRRELVAMLRDQQGTGRSSLRYGVDEAGDLHVWDGRRTMHADVDPDGAFVRTGEITSPFEIDAALAARRPGPINFGEALNPQTGAVNRVEPIGPTLGAARDEARIVEGWMRDAQPGPPTLHITDAVSSDPDAARRSVFRRLADALPVSDLRGQVNMFVGPRARPTPRTSGFVGPDGKRRYEISDEGMAWLPGGLERARRVWSGPPGGSARLDEIIRHDALFEAYPWMRAIRVGGDNLGGELGHVRHGALSARGDRINLDFGKHQTPEQRLEALQHEIQHIVQHHERFAPGGRPTPEQTAERGFFDAYSGIAGEAEAIDTTARRKLSLDERELLRPVLASGGDFEVRAPYAYPLGDAVRLGAGMGGGALAGGLAGAALSGQEAEASSLDGEGFDLSNVVMPVLGAVAGVAGAAGARSIARMGVGPVSRGTRRGAEAGAPVIPDDPSQWRDLMGRHPWINSPSRAQLIIMANARNANGAARYSLADIANATGYGEGSIPVALSQARRAGVPLESRPMGRAASGPPGGDLLNRFLDAAERRMRAGQAVRVREIAEQIGVKPESLSSMVSIARRAADGGDTNWRIPDSILTRIRAIPRTQTKSDRLASIAIPALAAAGLGALVLGGDEAEAQGLGPGFGPMPEGIDVREGRWVGERYPVTLPDGTEAFEQDLALPDGRRLRIVRSQSADGSVTVHGAYPARVVDPRDEIYESGDNYRLPYSAAVEEVEKPGWLAPAMSALPVLALFGGRVGPHITGRWGRFNPRQASAVGGAAFAGAGGAAIGAATEDEDMLDLTGLGAISGGAIGVAPRAGVDLLDNVRRTMPPIRLRVPRAKVRAQDLVPTRPPGAPSERVMDLDEAVIEAEFDLMRREGRRTLRATPAQRRLKRGSDMSLEERAAIPDGDRGSLSNRIGALNADQLRNLARELGLDTTGTKRALAARIASAAREGGEGVYARIRHLYPYL